MSDLGARFTRFRVLLALVAIVALAPHAAAQQKDVSVDAVFGWGGNIPTERWAPLTVYIHSPGRSLSGVMLIEYDQDSTQRAQVAAPFSVVADQTTAVQAVVCLPPNCEQVRITLVDERGRRAASASFSSVPSPRSAPIGSLRAHRDGLLVSLGLPRFPDAVRGLRESVGEGPQPDGAQPWRPVPRVPWMYSAAVSMPAADLPLAARAYDGVMALVVSGDAAAQVSLAAMDAVHEWVLSGGRLVIVADSAGEQWRSWLPSSALGHVELMPVRPGPVPREVAESIRSARGPEDRELTGLAPADSMPQRRARVMPAGQREGWRERFSVEEGEPGLIAEGPVGFGFVTVMGFDPMRSMRTISSHAAGAVWARSMDTIAGDFFSTTELKQGDNQFFYTRAASASQEAVNRLLDLIANVPVLGYTVFLMIAGSVLLLALLVGPVDYFALRRLRWLQRSWLTALVWIALASTAAVAVPQLVRTDPTQVNRLSVTDQLALDNGRVLSRQTGLTGIYAGSAGTARLEEVDPASWWRGIAAEYYYGSRSGGGAVVPTSQAAAGGEHGSRRGNVPWALPLAQWTFRTLLDESDRALPLRARIEQDGERSILVLENMPAGSRLTHALMRRGDATFVAMEFRPEHDAEAWRVPFRKLAGPSDNAVIGWGIGQVSPGALGQEPGTHLGGQTLRLPGADRRSLAIEHRVMTGRWAAVYLWLERMPPYPTLNWTANHNHTAIVRLLVPIEGEEG